MTGSLIFITEYSLLSIWVVAFVIRFRSRITCMVGMMSAMCLGMTIGLGVGTLVAALFPGHFFQACMISMLLAGFIGAMAGIPISTMAVLDGLLSGIMGGMMGAMLIAMLPAAYITPTLKITGVFTASIIFILLIMLIGEVKDLGSKPRSRLFFLPQTMFAVDILLFISLLFSHPLPTHMDNMSPEKHHHKKSNSNYTKELVITATDFAFTPQNLTIRAHENVKVTLANTGKAEHDFEIEGANVHIHAMPGSKDSDVIRIDKPGIYKAVCTLPGHKESGMVITLTVTP
ncbi:cupredoxin domain-containing protein [Paenibacillus sedimenti]|uniref:Cupredoxin domain-containing protein n=1 Tax=Paenibacillus sedimenti TaxID=2770274 RepID=A0A926KVW7_9BACL|nr:cupredoxin domain-containing protein [Paenibacillus sedimenti]MBD0383153.1 cupredoxin domain-containing protein [Paenibacillus sedimenti]